MMRDHLDTLKFSDPATEERFLNTLRFATQGDKNRMRNFFATVNYLMNWGRGEQGDNPTSIVISSDFAMHSFGWSITTYHYDQGSCSIKPNGSGMFIMMFYRQSEDQWETHS